MTTLNEIAGAITVRARVTAESSYDGATVQNSGSFKAALARNAGADPLLNGGTLIGKGSKDRSDYATRAIYVVVQRMWAFIASEPHVSCRLHTHIALFCSRSPFRHSLQSSSIVYRAAHERSLSPPNIAIPLLSLIS